MHVKKTVIHDRGAPHENDPKPVEDHAKPVDAPAKAPTPTTPPAAPMKKD